MRILFFYIYALRFDTLRFATGVGLEKVRIFFLFFISFCCELIIYAFALLSGVENFYKSSRFG